MDPNYDEIVPRIQQVYNSCSQQEQSMLRQILTELADSGYSYTYEQLFLSDFSEVPVSIDQFICGSNYLGPTNNLGDSVYPFWKQMFRNVFNSGNKYNEIILSGATRIGKTSSAVTIMAYMLYRLMIYRNPHDYFRKKAISKFTLAFANLTKDLAEGVAFHEFNSTLKESPWFLEHGTFTRSIHNPVYIPQGDKIDIVPASDAAHVLGMQVWCLKGDTQILTAHGVKTLEECENTSQEVLQLVGGQLVPTTADIRCTGHVTNTVRIELEDGSVIEGTPDHKVMLSDGTYKALGELRNSDDLLTLNIDKEVDEMHLSSYDDKFLVYIHTAPNGKKYVGITSKSTHTRWGAGGCCYKENKHFWNAIQKYGWDNIQHEIVATDLDIYAACKLEVDLIAKYDAMNPEHGYNGTSGGNWSIPNEETRKKISRGIRRAYANDPSIVVRRGEKIRGRHLTEEQKLAVSRANKGRKLPEEVRAKMRGRKLSPEARAKLCGHPSWCKGLTKETDERLMRVSEYMRSRPFKEEWRIKLSQSRKQQYQNGYSPVWITNGEIETSIQKGDALPEGFTFGRLGKANTYIHKGTESKKVTPEEAARYISEGWELGRPANVGETIRKANQKMHWEYEGMRFESATDLAAYLREHGYPKIVGSTVTALYLKGFSTSKVYYTLQDKVVRVDHENKVNPEN